MIPAHVALFDSIEFEINTHCNRQCSYCPNSILSRGAQSEMCPSLYKKTIDELALINFAGRISYDFYNEPMLCSHLLEFVSYTRRKLPSVKIVLYSNGTLLTCEKFIQLVNAGVTRFIITRHEGIDRLPLDEYMATLPEHMRALIHYRHYLEVPLTNRGGTLEHIGSFNDGKLLPCYVPSHVISITASGNVLPCFEDFHEKNIMGNLKNESLLDIWMSGIYQDFRSKLRQCLRHQFDPCRICSRVNARPMTNDSL